MRPTNDGSVAHGGLRLSPRRALMEQGDLCTVHRQRTRAAGRTDRAQPRPQRGPLASRNAEPDLRISGTLVPVCTE